MMGENTNDRKRKRQCPRVWHEFPPSTGYVISVGIPEREVKVGRPVVTHFEYELSYGMVIKASR